MAPKNFFHGQTYCFDELESNNHIRLLDVSWSTDRGNGLTFSLRQTQLQAKPTYEALSYCWGDSSKPKSICEVDTGRTLRVTRNCFSALYNLCYDGPRTLWVDAVCINQDDNTEKSQQLTKMADIYTLATTTIVYLGEEDRHWKRIAESIRTKSARGRGLYYFFHCGKFLERPWFSRTWTLQEIILSSQHTVVARIGTQNADYSALCQHLRREGTETWASVGGEFDLSRNLRYENLLRMLHETAWHQCSQSVDKFYAITSLFDEEIPPGLQVNYHRDEKYLYPRLMSFLLRSGQGAALYEAHGLRGSADLPSWVVDWTELASRYTNPTLTRFLGLEGRQHHRKWWHEQGYEPGVSIRTSGSVLTLKGWKVAAVESVETHSRTESLDLRLVHAGTMRRYLKGRPDWENLGRTVYRPPEYWEADESSWVFDEFEAGDVLRCEIDRVAQPGLLKRFVKETQVGDYVCAFEGFNYPFVLRSMGHQWILVKTCRLVSAVGRQPTELDTQWKSFPGRIQEQCETFELV